MGIGCRFIPGVKIQPMQEHLAKVLLQRSAAVPSLLQRSAAVPAQGAAQLLQADGHCQLQQGGVRLLEAATGDPASQPPQLVRRACAQHGTDFNSCCASLWTSRWKLWYPGRCLCKKAFTE